ncbi:MAG: ribonuclease III [Chitinispirillia bacterium]|nr:ribonuclease III [Chitinispirillia bacterium]MCL2269041.1 ribonuclease III [Chitinispirillia bacterium]
MISIRKILSLLISRKKTQACADPRLVEFQSVIGYKFRDAALLKHALTHKSCAGQDDPRGLKSNERLEFLGDSFINCLVTEYLYRTHPDKSEGHLSKIKSLVVSRKILGEVAWGLGMGNFLIMSHAEEKSGGRERVSTMSNAFEAIAGAIYLDGGIDPVRKFLEMCLFGRIAGFLEDERNVNYKSKILEMSQRDGLGIPRYVTTEATGPDHAKQFTVKIYIGSVEMGEGSGQSKKIAQQVAAQTAVAGYDKGIIG